MYMPVNIILPDSATETGAKSVDNGEYPVLWLLHGLSDDHTIWQTRTHIRMYADYYGLAVVMPSAHRSFYQDTASGLRYFSYICEELPELCQKAFRISAEREKNFLIGNSMGGYGAMRCALWRYDRYCAAYSFSGALDIENLYERKLLPNEEFKSLFGDPSNLEQSESNLLHLANEHVEQKNSDFPRLYACCGKDDFLVNDSRMFAEHMKRLGLPFEYLEDEGAHDWNYWQNHLEPAIQTLLNK